MTSFQPGLIRAYPRLRAVHGELAGGLWWVVIYALAVCYFGFLDNYKPLPEFINVYDVTVLLMLAYVAARRRGHFALPYPPLFWTSVLVVVAHVVSVMMSQNYQGELWISVFRYVEFVAVCLLLRNIGQPRDMVRLLRAILIIAAVESAIGVVQVLYTHGVLRGVGIGNQRGLYEFQALGVAYCFAMRAIRGRGAVSTYALIGLFMAGVLSTLIRTAWIELAVLGVLMLLWSPPRLHRVKHVFNIVCFMAIGAGCLLVLREAIPNAELRYQQMSEMSGSLDFRLSLWKAGLSAFESAPVFGVGSGVYPRRLAEFLAAAGQALPPGAGHDFSTHNTIVHFIAETGVVGTVSYLLYASAVAGLAISVLRRRNRGGTTRWASAEEQALTVALAQCSLVLVLIDFIAGGSFSPFSDTIIAMLARCTVFRQESLPAHLLGLRRRANFRGCQSAAQAGLVRR